MASFNPKLKQAIREIVGEDAFTDSLIDLVSYSYDASEHCHRPWGAVWPNSTEQVQRIMRLADAENLAVVPRGAGTGLAGSAVPARGGLVMDLARMNRIKRISPENRWVVLEPGVVYAKLQAELAPLGFAFPPDPASGKAATLGGNVATNAGGLQGAKYGVTRNYVLGLEVVLADGSRMRTGSACMKCVSGYDMTGLIVGSEGTLAIITEIILKIIPKPPLRATCTATFGDITQAGQAIERIMRSRITPSVLEILDEQCLRILAKDLAADLTGVKAMVLAEADGYTPEETRHQIGVVDQAFRENGAMAITHAGSEEEADRLWAARRSIGGALFKQNNTMLAEDVTVPLAQVTAMLAGIGEIARRNQVLIATLGHLGDGNLHPNVIVDGKNPEELAAAYRAVGELFSLAIELGGTLTGEHGIGLAKAPYMELEHDPVAMGMMRKVKQTFDPKGLLNPGKMNL